MAEYITRDEIETELLDESSYRGFYYNGFIYYIGRNSIVRNAVNTNVFEKVYDGVVYDGIGVLCGSRFIMPELYTTGSTVTTGGNFKIRFHIYDAETGEYTPNAYDQYIYTGTTYFYSCSVMGTLYYNEQTHLLDIYYGRLYSYPVPSRTPGCTTVNTDTMTVVNKFIQMSAVPLSGQPFDNVYLGSCVGPDYSWIYRAEWGVLNNRTLSDAVSDPTITTGLKGFVRGDNIYLVGGGLDGYYNHKLVSIHRTTHIKTVLYENEPFADSYAIKVDSDYYIPSFGKVVRYLFTPYPNTFRVVDENEDVVAEITQIPNIAKVTVDATSTSGIVILYDESDAPYFLTFPISPPAHTQFIGVSYVIGSSEPDIYIGTTHIGLINYSATFHIHYGIYDPDHHIDLYQMGCSRNVVDKTDYLSPVTELYGVFRESVSLTDPVFTINYGSVPRFNYLYIKGFARYYYVTDVVNIRENIWQISCHVDVLHTYRNIIMGLTAHVTRSEADFNTQLVDSALPAPVFSDISLQTSYLYEGEENPLDPLTTTGHYYLLTAIRKE